MKAILCLLFLQLGVFGQKECPKALQDTFSQLTDNLWGVQTLRKNMYASLSTSRSSSNQETYNAITTVMDSLRRRHLDLYPVLSFVPQLREQDPQQQLINVLQIVSNQHETDCAEGKVILGLRQRQIHSTIDLTQNLEKVRTFHNTKPINFVFNLIRERINTCIPSQRLIGAILINVPVRSSVSQAREDICSSLQFEKVPKHVWDATLHHLPIELESLTRWLALVIKTIGPYTNNNEKVAKLADGILQFDDPGNEPPSMERGRRSISDGLDQNVRTLSRAIAEYTLSIIRRRLDMPKKPQPPPPRPNFFLNPHAMITQIQEKISQQALSSSEDDSGETNITMAILRKNAANNTNVDENVSKGEGE